MATSFGALVLFGTVMIVMFFVFFLGNIREDMENILQNTLQNYQSKMQFIQDGAVMIRHNSTLQDFFDADWTDRAEMEKQLSYSMELFSNRNMTEGQSPFVTSVCLFNKKDEYVREHYYPMTVSEMCIRDRSYTVPTQYKVFFTLSLFCGFRKGDKNHIHLKKLCHTFSIPPDLLNSNS